MESPIKKGTIGFAIFPQNVNIVEMFCRTQLNKIAPATMLPIFWILFLSKTLLTSFYENDGRVYFGLGVGKTIGTR